MSAFSAILLAWSIVAFATGHVYVQYWRAPPLHFSEWSAFGFGVAIAMLATSLMVRIFDDKALARSISNGMLVASSLVALASLCVRSGLFSATSVLGNSFAGVVDDAALARCFVRPALADFAVASLPGVYQWLKYSCVCLLVLAVMVGVLGATKSTLTRYPRTSLVLMIGFASPFLAWLSLEATAYLFGERLSDIKKFPVWRARASLTASMLIVLAALWFFFALSLLVATLRSLGVEVAWRSSQRGTSQ
ncbi:hypothetical protein QTH91_03045 [Variovorax dokdonensis]|uniref:Uncharacterized protein n=1 Tax=Variovorax dokdonensis TaxID=344883 RepID=A0ABT7N698_9BURK|nr:hypothetical protein [Variovorax dokdonensis]MDM0043446.1 hypothetical protein [Variovorax dokdonensis]